ncbi:hypothetical protein LCGC14_2442830, partial [marine sediment metagenome]
MCPIDKISDIRRLPRLGRIRLGIKKEGQRGPYPHAVDYFVCPEEVKAVHGDTPRELPIMFPNDDLEVVAPQWMKCYSYSQGLICRGDGKNCRRKVDTTTGDFANRDTKEWDMIDGLPCDPEHCPKIGDKQCRRMMSLMFILPQVPGLGVYQLDTSSFFSIVNMNSQLAEGGFLRHFTGGRIAFIPLILPIEPRDVTPPGIGRKTVHILNVRAEVMLADIIRISRQRPEQVILPALSEDEPPEDLFPEAIIDVPTQATSMEMGGKEQGQLSSKPEETKPEPASPSDKPPAKAPAKAELPPLESLTEDDFPNSEVGYTRLFQACHDYFDMQPTA